MDISNSEGAKSLLLRSIGIMLMPFPVGCASEATSAAGFHIKTKGEMKDEVGVVNPGGEFFFVKADGIDCDGVDLVKDGVVLSKDVAGAVWINGVANIRPVFSSSGTYRVILSDNLESEQEGSFSLSFEVVYKKQERIEGKYSCSMRAG